MLDSVIDLRWLGEWEKNLSLGTTVLLLKEGYPIIRWGWLVVKTPGL